MVWVKGQSGNPGGKKKMPHEVRDALANLCPAAIKRIAQAINDPKDREGVKASFGVLEHTYGKPKQQTELTGKDGGPLEIAGVFSDVSNEELLRLLCGDSDE